MAEGLEPDRCRLEGDGRRHRPRGQGAHRALVQGVPRRGRPRPRPVHPVLVEQRARRAVPLPPLGRVDVRCWRGASRAAAMQLVLLHNYTAIGYDRGVLYELIGARKTGATKQQVLDTMAFAYPHSGPPHMSPSCAIALDYMDALGRHGGGGPEHLARRVVDRPRRVRLRPRLHGHRADRRRARPAEGVVPSGTSARCRPTCRSWRRHHPEGLKAYRSRYEYPTTHGLPKELFPLFTFFSSAYLGNATGMRRAIHQARHLGVAKKYVDRAGLRGDGLPRRPSDGLGRRGRRAAARRVAGLRAAGARAATAGDRRRRALRRPAVA